MEQTQATELWKALAAVQSEVGGVAKDSTNPHFKSKFANRTTILQQLQPVLQKHGLLLTQTPVPPPPGAEGSLALQTSFIHVETGHALTGVAVVPLPKADPQGFGSAMTYTSRYAIISMLALPLVEDDDGNAASGKGEAPTKGTTGLWPKGK